MPDYKTGSYIMNTRKRWKCEHCGLAICDGQKQFARIKEVGEEKRNARGEAYRDKEYRRYHLHCAVHLSDLDDYEQSLLGEFRPLAGIAEFIDRLEKSHVVVVQDKEEFVRKLKEFIQL